MANVSDIKKYNVSVVMQNNDGIGETCFSNGKFGFCIEGKNMEEAISNAKKRLSSGDMIVVSLLGKNGRKVSSYSQDFFEMMSSETTSDVVTV